MARIPAARLYATDEDIYIASSGDYTYLVPQGNVVARGTDGVFAADPPRGSWILTSASADFEVQGVADGMVCQITAPLNVFKSPDLCIVSSAVGSSLTLRRPGLDAGEGDPPGPIAGIAGVTYLIATLRPQIEHATFELNNAIGIDETVAGRTYADIREPRELQSACVSLVLWRQYLAAARNSTKWDDSMAKAKMYEQDYKSIVARLTITFTAGDSTSSFRQLRVGR
jgi:hypothetical protein